MTFFGSWLMVFDTSSRVNRDNDSRVLTLAGVAVPRESSDAVRELVKERLAKAGKWRDGGLEGFRIAEGITVSNTLRVAVTHMTGISQAAWHMFWDEGGRQAAKLRAITGQSANFAKGDSSIRLLLFGRIFAHCATHVLMRRGWKKPATPRRHDSVEFSAVFDTDIQNSEARDVLTVTLKDWAESGHFGPLENLELQVSGCFQTEEEEPLILLADYVAGAFNHAHPDASIRYPVAPLEQVWEAVAKFRSALGPWLQEVNQAFDEIHPLTGMWDGT